MFAVVRRSLKVPHTLREWRWKGSGPTVGGGQTTVCSAYYSATACYVTMYQSGDVEVEAVVNGVVKTERVWLQVLGGDSVPPAPKDTVPVDSIPSDTTGAGCSSSALRNGLLATCPPPETSTAAVSCVGVDNTSSIVRGSTVVCKIIVTPSKPYTVEGWKVDPQGGDERELPGVQTLEGPAVVATTVSARVLVEGQTAIDAAPASFDVTARSWRKLQLPDQTPYLRSRTYDPGGRLTTGDIRIGSILGIFVLSWPDFNFVPVDTAKTGPDAGYAYFAALPTLVAPTVFTHPQFGGGEWYQDQDGGVDPLTGAARCTAAIMPILEAKVEVHEGMTRAPNSHWGVAYDQLDFSRVSYAWEAMVDAGGSGERIQRTAQAQVLALSRRMYDTQRDFDDQDYPRIFGSLGCAIDLEPNPGDH